MKLIETLNKLRERLPIINGVPFRQALKEEFEAYNSLIKDVDKAEFENLLKVENQGRKLRENLTQKRFLNFIKKVQHTLNKVIEEYYNGYPSESFKLLNDLLYHNKFSPTRKGVKPISTKSYITESYCNYIKFNLQKGNSISLYRMRENPKLWTDRSEYFHLPDKYRGQATTARFSIPGFPCLYLGKSLEVCWKELNEPKENIYASKFLLQKDIMVLMNLTIPNQFDDDAVTNDSFTVFCFLITYPLLSACLMQIKEQRASFKPEYIVPQLILQGVRKDNLLEGIIYSSTKDKNETDEKYHNIVIPIQDLDNDGYCKVLKNNFHLSYPMKLECEKLEEKELANYPVQRLN